MIGVNPLPVLEVLRLGFGECSGPRDVVKRTVAVIAYLPFARTFGTQFEVVVFAGGKVHVLRQLHVDQV